MRKIIFKFLAVIEAVFYLASLASIVAIVFCLIYNIYK